MGWDWRRPGGGGLRRWRGNAYLNDEIEMRDLIVGWIE